MECVTSWQYGVCGHSGNIECVNMVAIYSVLDMVAI